MLFKKDNDFIVIVGLGNPENKFNNTRHNTGFEFIDFLSNKYEVVLNKNKFNSLYSICEISGKKLILVKPLTYMNSSGIAVKKIIDFYKIDITKNLIIVCDDINLDVGVVKVKPKGSDGGHNGLKNIINNICTNEFVRIRIGIGKPGKFNKLDNFVLGKFSSIEKDKIIFSYNKIFDNMIYLFDERIDKFTTEVNTN